MVDKAKQMVVEKQGQFHNLFAKIPRPVGTPSLPTTMPAIKPAVLTGEDLRKYQEIQGGFTKKTAVQKPAGETNGGLRMLGPSKGWMDKLKAKHDAQRAATGAQTPRPVAITKELRGKANTNFGKLIPGTGEFMRRERELGNNKPGLNMVRRLLPFKGPSVK
jgi:hypothetical protein